MQTVGDIIKEEERMILEAGERYGAPFKNAFDFNNLLQNFIKETNLDAWIFVMFLSQIRKHHTLAIFSAARLHGIQAKMNERQVIEAGVNAAYALANPNHKDFYTEDECGVAYVSKNLASKRYKWLWQNYPKSSEFLKKQKDIINSSAAHSGIIYAFKNFKFPENREGGFEMPFFDIEDEFYVKNDFWFLGNLAMGLMDLFYGVNQGCNRIKFKDDFIKELKTLEGENHRIKAEMMKNPRMIKFLHNLE